MDIFESCHVVNDFILSGDSGRARNELIKLLGKMEEEKIKYTPLVNNLIRSVGLFPYLDDATSSWQERYVYSAFKTDIGGGQQVTLHREQSRLLSRLLSDCSIAVSAPTSFGKSFVIDSFIAIKKPKNVVIIVPTVALTDETRRRLHKKFGREYRIITTVDEDLSEKNILVFPQERSISYLEKLSVIDILIVDEFYKASKDFDKDRSPSLIRSIMKLGKIAKQRYYLAPNINELKESSFTKGMEFLHLDFNTVFLQKHILYPSIGSDEAKKSEVFWEIISKKGGKTLVYAGTYSIKKISNLLMIKMRELDRPLIQKFKKWLSINYDPNWSLTNLVARGVGIHNGQLHRSLSQIQIKLFEEVQGLDQVVSTSSIIEGVNTSAKNVILWSNLSGRGRARINDFTYKNIIGRGGRMLKHFVGDIYILEKPPEEEFTQLELKLPDELLGGIDESADDIKLTPEQIAKIILYKDEMQYLLGEENFSLLKKNNLIQTSDFDLVLEIARDIKNNATSWNGMEYLNSVNAEEWNRCLYKIIKLKPSAWEIEWSKYVEFVKVLSNNWNYSIPKMLASLNSFDIGIDEFFKLERNTTFKLASLICDVGTIYNLINKDKIIDLSPAVFKFSHAFLPSIVFQLEEYGMPRMVAKKIHKSGILNLEDTELSIHGAINRFNELGIESLLSHVRNLDEFDKYIISYFYDGIKVY